MSAIVAVMIFFLVIAVRWSWSGGPKIIRSDAAGYYGYLHAIFITRDLGHEKFDVQYVNRTPEGTLNKYFAGEALMVLPFFLCGHAVAHISHAPLDGYSLPYQRAISIAALVYALLGLLALRAMLRRLDVGEGPITTVVLVLGFGTQFVQYVAMQPGWSHAYSFCAVSVFLWLTLRIASRASTRSVIAWGALFGLIILIRPVNALVVLAVPLLLGNGTMAFIRSLMARPMALFAALVICTAVVAVQCALWNAQTGHVFARGYAGEGFYWSRPEIFQVLLGVRRGLFVWTPVLVLAAIAAVLLIMRDRVRGIAAVVYWGANTYVISAWWIWYYGSGWGQRVFIDHYPALIVPLALALHQWRGWRLRTAQVFLGTASLFTMGQFYQYNHRLLHIACMDKAKYAYSFMRFDDAHRDRLGGLYEVPPYCPNGMDTLLHERWDAERGSVHWHGQTMAEQGSPSGQHAVVSSVTDEFGPEFSIGANELVTGRWLYLAIGFERHVARKDDTRHLLAVATVEEAQGRSSFYRPFEAEPLPPKHDDIWEHIEYRIPVPPMSGGERLKFYFWDQHLDSRFEMDDLDITIYAVRPF